MSLEPNTVGYHTNHVSKSDDFVNRGVLVLSVDQYYLGKGMYFWDNLGNAKYWARKKLREDQRDTVKISSANIVLSQPILDLTDMDVISRIRKLWVAYCEKLGERRVNQYLGTILDTLWEFFDEIREMKVFKGHGDYSSHRKHRFISEQKTFIDSRPKTIYAVRCASRIKNREHVETLKRQ